MLSGARDISWQRLRYTHTTPRCLASTRIHLVSTVPATSTNRPVPPHLSGEKRSRIGKRCAIGRRQLSHHHSESIQFFSSLHVPHRISTTTSRRRPSGSGVNDPRIPSRAASACRGRRPSEQEIGANCNAFDGAGGKANCSFVFMLFPVGCAESRFRNDHAKRMRLRPNGSRESTYRGIAAPDRASPLDRVRRSYRDTVRFHGCSPS